MGLVNLIKRMAELSRDMSGIRRAIARDLRTGESFIVMENVEFLMRNTWPPAVTPSPTLH